MSAVLTAQQETALIEAATVRRHLDVPDVWVVTRLGVLVDARLPGVREAAAHQVAVDLHAGLAGHLRARLTHSTHGHDRAAAVLQDIRVRLADRTPGAWRLVLSEASDPDCAAEVLAGCPHGALVVAVAICDGRALAARWS